MFKSKQLLSHNTSPSLPNYRVYRSNMEQCPDCIQFRKEEGYGPEGLCAECAYEESKKYDEEVPPLPSVEEIDAGIKEEDEERKRLMQAFKYDLTCFVNRWKDTAWSTFVMGLECDLKMEEMKLFSDGFQRSEEVGEGWDPIPEPELRRNRVEDGWDLVEPYFHSKEFTRSRADEAWDKNKELEQDSWYPLPQELKRYTAEPVIENNETGISKPWHHCRPPSPVGVPPPVAPPLPPPPAVLRRSTADESWDQEEAGATREESLQEYQDPWVKNKEWFPKPIPLRRSYTFEIGDELPSLELANWEDQAFDDDRFWDGSN